MDSLPKLRRPLTVDERIVLPAAAQPMSRGRLLITLATYNEIDNLPDLVADILTILPSADILVVDDNSPDGTGRWCDVKAAEDNRVCCLHREKKLRLGTAIIAGLRHALTQGYEYVINMDADYSHHPVYIPELLSGMEEKGIPKFDVMIGSRYISGGGIQGWPFVRHVMSQAVNVYSRWMLRLPVRDCSGGFRCYRTSMLQNLDWDLVQSVGYAFQEEILWHLRRAGARIGEIPVVFVNRRRGESKIDAREAASALWVIGWLGVTSWMKK